MDIGYIGLGKMGIKMALLLGRHFNLSGYDISSESLQKAREQGIRCEESLRDLAGNLTSPRVFWIMVNHGKPVDHVIEGLSPYLNTHDILIDGGNSFYKDSVRRRNLLARRGIAFLAVGASGGLDGAENGPPMIIDGEGEAYRKVQGLFEVLGGNYSYFKGAGKAHLAKSIHNAIEYGMMQSIAEGVLLYHSHGFSQEEILDVFRTWSNGSIIESRLVTLLVSILEEHKLDERVAISHSETAETIRSILEKNLNTPVIESALIMREHPEMLPPVVMSVLAHMRKSFGGHNLKNG